MPSSHSENLFGTDDTDPTSSIPSPVDPNAPLAARMRPQTLDEFAGQETIVGPGTLLRRAIENDQLTSVILWGPPGTGKSTLAQIIARTTRSHFEKLNSTTSGVADVRKVIETAKERRRKLRQKTILFVDEIHRWNKSQQDALLPHVEDGTVVLIGATTENPYFEVNAPLLSRSRLFRFERLSDAAIRQLLERALSDTTRGLGALRITADPDALDFLAHIAGGDARNALSALESAAQSLDLQLDPQMESAEAKREGEQQKGKRDEPKREEPKEGNPAGETVGRRHLTLQQAEEGAQARSVAYDKTGDEHYDTVSAFIKSIRGSDPDAGLYWLAKMLAAGEDLKFIARRLVILASEDIGNADPMALVLANAAVQTVMFIGLPEAQLTLSQTVCYLAAAPKSNACTLAIGRATEQIKLHGALPVPVPLRDSHYPGAKQLGHGTHYLYPHDFPNHYVAQQYLPDGVQGTPFYEPTEEGAEAEIKAHMHQRREVSKAELS